jgi:hypothetical protein
VVSSPTTPWIADAIAAGTAGAELAVIAVRRPGSAIRLSDTEKARSSCPAVAVTEIDRAPRLSAPGVSPRERRDRRTARTWAPLAPKRRANWVGVRYCR